MSLSLAARLILGLAGIVACAIGSAILLFPLHFYAEVLPTGATSPSLLSDLRAAGAVVLAGGLVTLVGAFSDRFSVVAAWSSSSLYLSYGAARLLGWLLDGPPTPTWMWAAAVELALGLACVWVLSRSLRGRSFPSNSDAEG
ncbi:MAG TPA: DUF4345 domain-containing protein [Polyangiaceae bacterium]|nr:DUF4345 domain-containing protein [Polyangiaceae bacterium]